jgi:signal transduction histidine kinase
MSEDSAHILVAEDDKGVRHTLAASLEKQGYRVTACQSGREALSHVEQDPPDVVIADLRLPDASGLEILETLKEINPEAAFILMTGYATVETAVDAVNEGAFAYITKPFRMDQVHTVVHKALKQQRLLVENRRLVESLQRTNKELHKEVAERKRAEEALAERTAALEAANKELEAFTYTVSHDLKAPLRGMEGFARAILDDYADRLDETGRHYLDMIRGSACRMGALIDDLLRYSRLERGQMKASQVALRPLVEQVCKELGDQIDARGLSVVVGLTIENVDAERQGLHEALANLVENAVKFSGDGGGTITIRSQQEGDAVILSVTDTGIGFDMKYHDRIFGIFERLHRQEDYPGTGVGLAIVQKVAERHRGRAWAESEPGKGSTFYLAIQARTGETA